MNGMTLPSTHMIRNSSPGDLRPTQRERDVHSKFVECWASVADNEPTLKQHWVNVSCLLGILFTVPQQAQDVP